MYNIFFEKSKKNNHKNFLIQKNNVNNSSLLLQLNVKILL